MKVGPILLMVGVVVLLGGCLVLPDLYGQIVMFALAGWLFFLLRTLPQLTIGWEGLLTGLFCLALLAGGLHGFLRWFQRGWAFRWTLCLLAGVMLSFVAGLAAVGIHQHTLWLVNSKQLLQGGAFEVNGSESNPGNQAMP